MDKSNGDDSTTNSRRNAEDNRTTTGQAADSNNASNIFVQLGPHLVPLSELLLGTYRLGLSIRDAVNKIDEKLENFSKVDCDRNEFYKRYFNACYTRIIYDLRNLANRVSRENSAPQTSGQADNTAENTQKASVSESKREECVLQVGPSDVVLILDSTLFNVSGQVQITKTANGDYAATTYVIDGQKKSIVENQATMGPTKEQKTQEDCPVKRKTCVLDIEQSVDFKAKHLEPVVSAERGVFRVSFDVSLFDIENITCSVGDKLEVRARVSRQSDYGSEMHEILRVFEVPKLVDREKFTACIRDGFLHVEAPMKPSTEALMDTS